MSFNHIYNNQNHNNSSGNDESSLMPGSFPVTSYSSINDPQSTSSNNNSMNIQRTKKIAEIRRSKIKFNKRQNNNLIKNLNNFIIIELILNYLINNSIFKLTIRILLQLILISLNNKILKTLNLQIEQFNSINNNSNNNDNTNTNNNSTDNNNGISNDDTPNENRNNSFNPLNNLKMFKIAVFFNILILNSICLFDDIIGNLPLIEYPIEFLNTTVFKEPIDFKDIFKLINKDEFFKILNSFREFINNLMINEIKLLKFKSNFLYGYIFIEFIGELKSRNLIYTISINLIIIVSQLILFINITNFKVNDKININRIEELNSASPSNLHSQSQSHSTTRGNHIDYHHTNHDLDEEEEEEDREEDYQFVDEYSDNYNEEELDTVTRLDEDQEINQYSNDIVEDNGNVIGSIDFYPSTDTIMKCLRSIWDLR